MSVKVELGFTATGASAPFLTLDNPVRGLLDSPQFVLGGGEGLVDVSSFVRRVSINRGKSRELDRYNAGSASVEFNNQTRAFDPTFAASPFFGQIVPQRQLKISVDDQVAYVGTVDDWSIDYEPSGMSVASCNAFDAISNLSNLTLTDFAPDEEISGARVTAALANVGWPVAAQTVDPGVQLLESQIVSDGASLVTYLQTVASSEPGEFFVNKLGQVAFVDRNNSQVTVDVTLSDDSDIPYQSLQVVFGSELLYNQITVSNSLDSVTATNPDSIAAFGERDFSLPTFIANEAELQTLAAYLANEYANPEFRFEQAVINLTNLSETDRDDILALELGQIITVKFTPAGIPPEILRASKVIGISHDIDPNIHRATLRLATLRAPVFVLNSAVFGKLDNNILGL